MLIRKANKEEMLELWGYQDLNDASPTAEFFCNIIAGGNAVFWTLDNDGELIGELYVFFDLEDKDFADGENTAYLCALRVKKEYRGQGYGSLLMTTALSDLKEKGFHRATIGVNIDEPLNIDLYRRLGFNVKVKDCHYDPCARDNNMQPMYDETSWWLLSKYL